MDRSPALALRGAAVASALPLAVYAGLRLWPALDPVAYLEPLHFVVGCALAVIGSLIGGAVALAGVRLRNLQVVLLAMSFLSLGLLQAVHGLATPGMVMSDDDMLEHMGGAADHLALLPATAQLSVLLAAGWLWLSSLPSWHPLIRPLARHERQLPVVWTILLLLLDAALLRSPQLIHYIPVDSVPLRYVVAALTLALVALSVRHYARGYRYARLPLQISTVYGALWLAGAQLVLTTAPLWHLSWWLYHFLLYAGVGAGVWGLLRQYGQGERLQSAVLGLWNRDADALLQSGISPAVRELVGTLEAHDPYTAGHSYRVAREAVRLGRAAGCTPEELRALAQGGLVHDLGKLEVARDLLNKEAGLSPTERAAVERHPVRGHAHCQEMGFLPEELAVVRHHHERWDGQGYPDRLAGPRIPRLARIAAIADVYDALTSDRAYRSAWSHGRARHLIEAEAGTHFDPELVQVWLSLPDPGERAQDAPVPRAPKHPTVTRFGGA